MKLPLHSLTILALLATSVVYSGEPYDFRASAAYKELSDGDRQRLEQVRRDQLTLWGALDLYGDQHNDELPTTLDALVPQYLTELPSDPFVTQPATEPAQPGGYTPSKGGFGYGYRKGGARNRAWIVISKGLPDFPYLGARNSGLYLCKGTWISGMNPVTVK